MAWLLRQVRGQPEEWEQRLRVEEPAELDEYAVGDVEDLQRPGIVPAARRAPSVLAEGGLPVGDGGDES